MSRRPPISLSAICSMACWSAPSRCLRRSVSESAATAAIIALAFTIGSWVLDFALAGQPGVLEWIARLSLTQTLRTFEQGLLSIGLVLGVVAAICGFAALAAVWLHPGVPLRTRLMRSLACVVVAAIVLASATQVRTSLDLTEDRRNSFPAADQRALAELREPLLITVHLAAEDPRYVDLRRNVLSKLERVVPTSHRSPRHDGAKRGGKHQRRGLRRDRLFLCAAARTRAARPARARFCRCSTRWRDGRFRRRARRGLPRLSVGRRRQARAPLVLRRAFRC